MIWYYGEVNFNNNFFSSISSFDKSVDTFQKGDIVFVTDKFLNEVCDFDVNIVLMSRVPSLDHLLSTASKCIEKVKGYINFMTHEIHFSQIINVIESDKIYLNPNVKKELDNLKNKKT